MSSQPPLARSIQKLFPFFFLSLSRQDRCWYRRGLLFLVVYYSFEREDRPPIDYYYSFFSLNSGDFKPSSPFCERALFKSDVFSLSLFFARSSQHHSGDDDDARPTFCRRPVTPTHSRSRALGERTRLNFKKPSRDRF